MFEIKHNENMFYMEDEDGKRLAKITYYYDGDTCIVIEHTVVSEKLKGQGVALKLVNSVVEFARRNHLKIRPECSYAVKVLTGDEAYKDVLMETSE